jgi:hypothetical protein
MTVEELLQKNPDQIADALRVIVQYPRQGVLASPLARTLNIAFFPMRYNAKVTIMTANILAKQPPSRPVRRHPQPAEPQGLATV